MKSVLLRPLACALLLATPAALAVKVGDTYAQVVAEKGAPASKMEAGTRQMITYPDAVVRLEDGVVTSVRILASPAPAPAATMPSPPAGAPAQPKDTGPVSGDVAEARAKLNDALARVRAIVNQPVESFPLTDEIKYKAPIYRPGWFHPGAVVPDFNVIEVEKTQELNYAKDEWVTSDATPGLAFRGADLEFNAMTKLFYVDRSLPKKKLTVEEMKEIDQLYRKIGIYAATLQRLGHPWAPAPGGAGP
jgi:hypothetical protein